MCIPEVYQDQSRKIKQISWKKTDRIQEILVWGRRSPDWFHNHFQQNTIKVLSMVTSFTLGIAYNYGVF
jgi:hypothetical protein